MANRRIGGIMFVKVDGTQLQAKGSFEYDLGIATKEMIAGVDGVHGFKELPKMAKVSGSITDSDELDYEALLATRDATVTLELANGKVIVIEEAVLFESTGNTEEGELSVEFQGVRGREISP